ncbi:MAG: GFA family protein [Antarcticimicrobium sp.]|uniref:GFA family protein n=1 Tax=Antarcticimicrobium sp. TaxID=2824147 RepID=UPI002617BD02|nr:GFA family protein [Antarcticimicrobium sp.]MDF1716659.1 GFA family protein [Antarcticimicrobium sp.]
MTELSGQCLCGAVSITAKLLDERLTVCNCDMCRRWTSAAFMSVRVDQDSITIDGKARRFQSSDWAERGFCDTCGSNLWYRITAEGPGHGHYNFAAGLFGTGEMKIGREFFVDTKPQGYRFAGDHARLTEAETFALFAPKDEGETQ